ncbi:hypothetical protein A6A07_13760 [Streptomyces sp. CB03911]|nr:hypothetical protein A6A07_13760 [Streptomyces sp. CB03911]
MAATEEQEDGRHHREEAGGDSGSRALVGGQAEHRRRGAPGRGGREQQPEVRRRGRDGRSFGCAMPKAVADRGSGRGRRRRRSRSRRSSGAGTGARITGAGRPGGVGTNGGIDDGSPPRFGPLRCGGAGPHPVRAGQRVSSGFNSAYVRSPIGSM